MVEKRRFTAIKVNIKDIIEGKFVKNPGNNYALTKQGMKLVRVRLLGTVVDKFSSEEKKFASATIDDGTDTIRLKAFASFILNPINVGDIIDVVGKLKQFDEEIFVVPEVLWKADPNYEILRKLEVEDTLREFDKKKAIVLSCQKQTSDLEELKRVVKEYNIEPEEIEAIMEAQSITEDAQVKQEDTGAKEKILGLIESLDRGDGCDYLELAESSDLGEDVLDSVIEQLLEEGTCFEPKPGKIKKIV